MMPWLTASYDEHLSTAPPTEPASSKFLGYLEGFLFEEHRYIPCTRIDKLFLHHQLLRILKRLAHFG